MANRQRAGLRRRRRQVIEALMDEWTIGPGGCERCGTYVSQLVRRGGSWVCDECHESHEHKR